MSNTTRPLQKPLDEQEFKRLQQRLTDWHFHDHHHLHRSWQFSGCQEALHWHRQAQALSDRHGGHCVFDLGHVGSGRIETDILNLEGDRLSRDDLGLAVLLNALADDCWRPANSTSHGTEHLYT